MNPFRLYAALTVGIFVLVCLSVGSFNYALDASGLYRNDDWNTRRTALDHLNAGQWPGLVLGSSRVRGFPEQAEVWPDGLGEAHVEYMFAASFDEYVKVVSNSRNQDKLKVLIIGLDYFAFNSVYEPEILHVVDWKTRIKANIRWTLTIEGLGYRLNILRLYALNLIEKINRLLREQPLAATPEAAPPSLPPRNERDHFLKSLTSMITRTYYGNAYGQHTLSYPGTAWQPHVAALRDLTQLAGSQGFTVILFFHPTHAWEQEFIRLSGLWPAYEDWKRDVVSIAAQANRDKGRDVINVWDFSGYNCWTREPVPAWGRMRNHTDVSHYAVGNLAPYMVATMNGISVPPPACEGRQPGVRLTPDNIEFTLASIRADQAAYGVERAEELALVEQTVKRALRRRRALF